MTTAGSSCRAYPERAKVHNLRRDPRPYRWSIQSDEFNGAWVQVDGTAEVVDLPDALDGLCDYYRVISGEHPDWDEYRQAMQEPGQVPDPDHDRGVGSDRHGWFSASRLADR